MTLPILISAYAASPAHTTWDPVLEKELLAELCRLPDVVGLEVPWLGALHPHDPRWFLQNVPVGALLSLTPLPWVMKRCAQLPAYGLASADPAGRAAALDDLRRLAADTHRITEESPARASLVSLYTAPRGGGNKEALSRSIDELIRWDWGGVQLNIEHCDAAQAGQSYEKGFLPIEEEIAVLNDTGAPIGLWMNWGRSAIELRHANAVTAQIDHAAQSGHLRGLTFSGAADTDGPYGVAWADAHLPIAATDASSQSILNDEAVAAALAVAGGLPWYGVKVSRRPTDQTAAEVVRTVSANLDVIRRAAELF